MEQKQLASPTELLSQAWEIVRSRFWVLLVCMLMPMFVGAGIMITFIMPVAFLGLGGILGGVGPFVASPMFIAGFILSVIIFVCVSLWQSVAMIQLIAGAGEKLGVVEAFKKSRSKIWGVLWIGLISGAIVMGAVLPLVIPVFIIGVWFAYGQYVYVIENVGGLAALRISREYVRGKFWAVFGRMLFPILIYIGLGIVQSFVRVAVGKEVFPLIQWIFSIISLILSLLVMVYQFCLYNNLKQIRGQIDPKDVESGKTKWVLLAIWGLLGWLIIPLGAVFILIMINPAKQLQKARDTNLQFQLQQQQLERQIKEIQQAPQGSASGEESL